MSPDLNHQSSTMSKEQRNLVLFSYATVLQKEAETRPEMGNVTIPSTNKRSCVVQWENLTRRYSLPGKE